MGIIYKATSPSGLSYIGQTIYGIEARWRDHKYDALDPKKDRCRVLNNAIRKYGAEAFTLEVLCECPPEELDTMEQFFIETQNTQVPNGYNLKVGGGVCYHSQETKESIKNAMKGKTFSEEQIRKRSQTKKGSELPMFIAHRYDRNNKKHIGYRVKVPGFPERCFQSSSLSMDEKLQRARQYLEECNTNAKDAVQRL
jgi:group I intron endonuclease